MVGLLVLLGCSTLVAYGVFAAIVAGRKLRRRMSHELSVMLGGSAGKFSAEGRAFKVEGQTGKRGFTAISTELELSGAGGGDSPYRARGDAPLVLPRVLLRKECARDRVGKLLSLNREARTGDAAFDEKVYIESDASDAEIVRLLEGEELKRTVIELLAMPVQYVAFNYRGHALTAQSLQGQGVSAVPPVASVLDRIAKELPPIGGLAPVRWDVGQVTTLVSAIVAVLSWLAYAVAPEFWQPLDPELRRTALRLVLFVVPAGSLVIWLVVRRRSNGFGAFVLSMIFLVVTAFTAPFALLTTVNGALDEPEVRVVNVARKWTEKVGRRSDITKRYMALDPWPPVAIELSLSDWRRVSAGAPARIRVGSGFLGFEWYAGLVEE
jgi:hypothetical protein